MDTLPPAGAPAPRQRIAIASLVLGILGTLGLGPLAGVPALILGHLARRRARHDPARYGGVGFAVAGLVFGYVSLVVGLAMLAVLLSFAVPAFQRFRARAQESTCRTHLQYLQTAARLYAADHQDLYPNHPTLLAPQLRDPANLVCPADRQHVPLASTNWADLRPVNSSYLFLVPGLHAAECLHQPIFRCPVHGTVIHGDGSLVPRSPRPPPAPGGDREPSEPG